MRRRGCPELRVGEVIDGRYKVASSMGKGVFSTVCRATDITDGNQEVAIKVIRNNETMYKAGLKEALILRTLNESDPKDKKHVIRLLRQFEHRGHLCLVFESLRYASQYRASRRPLSWRLREPSSPQNGWKTYALTMTALPRRALRLSRSA